MGTGCLDAGVLVFEPRLPDQPFDLAVASGDGLGVEHELDLLLESHVSMDSSSMISRSLSPMAWIGYNVLDGLLRDLATKE